SATARSAVSARFSSSATAEDRDEVFQADLHVVAVLVQAVEGHALGRQLADSGDEPRTLFADASSFEVGEVALLPLDTATLEHLLPGADDIAEHNNFDRVVPEHLLLLRAGCLYLGCGLPKVFQI